MSMKEGSKCLACTNKYTLDTLASYAFSSFGKLNYSTVLTVYKCALHLHFCHQLV